MVGLTMWIIIWTRVAGTFFNICPFVLKKKKKIVLKGQ